MIKYIVRDFAAMLRYLPYGVIVGILTVLVLSAVRGRRVRQGKPAFSVVALASFFTYAVIMLVISFLSRESGSTGGIDMEFLSTWGINTRNKAYLIENIIFFIPFGYTCAWAFRSVRKLLVCMGVGALTSLGIECMQLVTGRGVFQIDDFLTNTLGALLGCLLFRCVSFRKRRQ